MYTVKPSERADIDHSRARIEFHYRTTDLIPTKREKQGVLLIERASVTKRGTRVPFITSHNSTTGSNVSESRSDGGSGTLEMKKPSQGPSTRIVE